MKRILVTGGAGFVGHHFIEYLLRHTDWEIISLDRIDGSATLERLADVLNTDREWHRRVCIVWHDLKAPLNDWVQNSIEDIDYAVHLAAGSHVDRSIEDPLSFAMDNVIGTVNLLNYLVEQHQNAGLEKAIYFSTDEVFGPAPDGCLYEPWARYSSGNPYAASKAGGEEFALAYHNTYALPVAVTHSMNLYGIRQHPEKFIPMCMRKTKLGECIEIHADADCRVPGSRFYTFVEDVSSALLLLLDNGTPGEKYNIVGEKEIDNAAVARAVAEYIGTPPKLKFVDFHSSRPGHDLRYALAESPELARWGWKRKGTFEENIKDIAQWSLAHPKWIGL